MGKQKSVKKRKLPDIKSLIFGNSHKENTVIGSRFPNGTQSLVPVVDIRSGVVITEDGRYVKILEVLPTNFHLKSLLEQQNIIYYMASYLRIAPVSLQILVQTGRADIDSYCEQMQKCYEAEKNEMCKSMILEDAQLVNYLAANEAVTRKFYLIFKYEGTTTDFAEIAKQLAEKRGLARMSAQAVGGAVGHNEISIMIPCHRVVGTNGSLTGYAGGIDKKIALLALERADMSRFFVPKKGTAL